MTKKIDFDFQQVDGKTFQVDFTMTAQAKLINIIFGRVKGKLNRKDIDKDYTDMEEFEVPESYHNLVRVALKKPMKNVIKKVGARGIRVMTHNIKQASFKKIEKDWFINIRVTGDFIDER